MAVDTKAVTGRRTLKFATLDDISAELDGLEGRPIRTLGNWSVGQNLMHLAIPMNGAIDGLNTPMPWYIRMGARMMKKKFLNGVMPAGFQLPKHIEAEMVPPSTVTTEEGFAAIRRGLHRLKTETHREPHPVFGPLSIDEWNTLMCRHCELHLGFLVPEN